MATTINPNEINEQIFLNFTKATQQATINVPVIMCGVCGSANTYMTNTNGIIVIVCLNCGTTELQPAPSAIAQQQTQAVFTAAANTSTPTTTMETA